MNKNDSEIIKICVQQRQGFEPRSTGKEAAGLPYEPAHLFSLNSRSQAALEVFIEVNLKFLFEQLKLP